MIRLLLRWVRRSDSCRTCGHPKSVHEHYRRGSDCGLCRCERYR